MVKKSSAPPKPNILQRILQAIDMFQQKHKVIGFPYAVIKKYGDDEAGYQGALITYYGFLSLFPLLIVATSVIDLVSRHNAAIRTELLDSINQYFPAIGHDLQSSIHSTGKTGLALAAGLLITFYGAKGVADAIQHALNHVWEVPKAKRASFPKGPLKSLAVILGGGFGFMSAAVLSGYATGAVGNSVLLRIVPLLISAIILFASFIFIFRVASSAKHSYKQLVPGAIVAAIGLQILQFGGTYLLTHQLTHLSGIYGKYGLVLAILFWLYLQAQVFLYAAEISAVGALKLWPRSLTGKPLTSADREALRLYAQRETIADPPEEVQVTFAKKP